MVEIKAKETEKENEQARTNYEDALMWYRIGHFLRWIGAALLILGAGIFLMALAVHQGVLPTYTKTLLILIAIIGLGGIIAGNGTIASVYSDPDFTGENDEKKRRQRK